MSNIAKITIFGVIGAGVITSILFVGNMHTNIAESSNSDKQAIEIISEAAPTEITAEKIIAVNDELAADANPSESTEVANPSESTEN
mgnify:CR=1 FL=1